MLGHFFIGGIRLAFSSENNGENLTILLMVGAAGSLEVAPGVQLIDSGRLLDAWRPIALSHPRALEELKASDMTGRT